MIGVSAFYGDPAVKGKILDSLSPEREDSTNVLRPGVRITAEGLTAFADRSGLHPAALMVIDCAWEKELAGKVALIEDIPLGANTFVAAVRTVEVMLVLAITEIADDAVRLAAEKVAALHEHSVSGATIDRKAFREVRGKLATVLKHGPSLPGALALAAAWPLDSSPMAVEDVFTAWYKFRLEQERYRAGWSPADEAALTAYNDHQSKTVDDKVNAWAAEHLHGVEIGTFLKDEAAPKELRNAFWEMLDATRSACETDYPMDPVLAERMPIRDATHKKLLVSSGPELDAIFRQACGLARAHVV